jgi:argininosuccinate lyase
MPVEELIEISQYFDSDAAAVFDMQASVALRSTSGGTAPQQVAQQIEYAKIILQQEISHVESL